MLISLPIFCFMFLEDIYQDMADELVGWQVWVELTDSQNWQSYKLEHK